MHDALVLLLLTFGACLMFEIKRNTTRQLLRAHRSLLYAAVCALIVDLQLLYALGRWLPWSQSCCGSHSRALGPAGAWSARFCAHCAQVFSLASGGIAFEILVVWFCLPGSLDEPVILDVPYVCQAFIDSKKTWLVSAIRGLTFDSV